MGGFAMASPRPTRDLVLSKAKQLFPDEDPDAIMALLDEYGREPHESVGERVQLAILKLSDGDEDRLLDLVVTAKRDDRDVIYPAEYPEFWRIGLVGVDKLDATEIRQLKERDLRQYLSWLQNTDDPDLSGYEDWLAGRDK
jgi:hypothetical protein